MEPNDLTEGDEIHNPKAGQYTVTSTQGDKFRLEHDGVDSVGGAWTDAEQVADLLAHPETDVIQE